MTRGPLALLIEAIWTAVQTQGPGAAIVKHRLPQQFWRGEWCAQVLLAGRGRVATVELARTVLALADGVPGLAGLDMLIPTDVAQVREFSLQPATACLKVAVQSAVEAVSKLRVEDRRAVATYVVARLGDPYRGGIPWTGLDHERACVRAWLAAEFLTIFFAQLQPWSHRDQCEERAEFWTRYAAHITGMTLFVGDDIGRRLRTPEMRTLLAGLGSLVRTAELRGKGADGAGLWIVLQDQGNAVTVLEWNAQGAMRHSAGVRASPVGTPTAETVRSAAGYHTETHQGEWQGKFISALSRYNIHPTRA